jgi:catechol 2,3-dioxygenase-like lactoylglutathione lyase family enzyme
VTTESAVEFETESRVHIGLEVADRDRAVAFYRVLLGVEPAKVRPGYAKFEPAAPPLNLSLIEHPGAGPTALPASLHYGIQVKSTEDVRRMAGRLEAAGIATRVEEEAACCYAVQTKVWATDPDGHRWEVFVVLGDAERRADATAACCPEAEAACCPPGATDCC